MKKVIFALILSIGTHAFASDEAARSDEPREAGKICYCDVQGCNKRVYGNYRILNIIKVDSDDRPLLDSEGKQVAECVEFTQEQTCLNVAYDCNKGW